MIELRNARIEELRFLTELCLRSKAVWGYDDSFMQSCRNELTLSPDDLASTHVQVAVNGDLDKDILLGVAQIGLDGQEANLLKLFVEPQLPQNRDRQAIASWASTKAATLGARQLIVEADPDAVPFYRRQGAKLVGSAPSGSIRGDFFLGWQSI